MSLQTPYFPSLRKQNKKQNKTFEISPGVNLSPHSFKPAKSFWEQVFKLCSKTGGFLTNSRVLFHSPIPEPVYLRVPEESRLFLCGSLTLALKLREKKNFRGTEKTVDWPELLNAFRFL